MVLTRSWEMAEIDILAIPSHLLIRLDRIEDLQESTLAPERRLKQWMTGIVISRHQVLLDSREPVIDQRQRTLLRLGPATREIPEYPEDIPRAHRLSEVGQDRLIMLTGGGKTPQVRQEFVPQVEIGDKPRRCHGASLVNSRKTQGRRQPPVSTGSPQILHEGLKQPLSVHNVTRF
ncbi:hypothetical protein GCM10027580_25600 [Corynebacterium faecale]